MQTIDEIRRENLELAVQRLGGKAVALANAAGLSAAYISQIRTKQPDSKSGKPKSLGDDAARKVEAAIGERAGWMDVRHGDDAKPAESANTFTQGSYAMSTTVARLAKILDGREQAEIDMILDAVELLLKVGPTRRQGEPEPEQSDQPVFSRKKRVIEFTGLHPSRARGRQGAK
ncbi:hypothetical protein [Cupriavidus numazuensis]|uniref:Uncharacterized protein n=1 Tax=Cupriavidus numazuensis TaxID=221992 RepID=A0ABN7PXB1_9BURK|nr:hypothetical protein [Cupriavidus numazuensis]CAG2132301.1 hypothetical protein LMG26411_00592 [Cupriavidus numazuensis]